MNSMVSAFCVATAVVGIGAGVNALRAAQRSPSPVAAVDVAIDNDDIGGVVTSAKGPEAGVWVIAETTELPTTYRKIVVTDDRGRFLLPDLPKATYRVWVRGYGLVDSPAVSLTPGRTAALRAVIAPTALAAAQYYPSNYWYALITLPPKTAFPGTGTGPGGNGIGENMQTQDHWIIVMKTGCETCHQIGTKATREIPESLGKFKTTKEAWDHRAQTGQDGVSMTNGFTNMGRDKSLSMYAEWTDRVNAGAVPAAPPRPQGIERTLVLTEWEWGNARTFAHDELATDKRHPTANANGPIYGVDWGNDAFLIADPVANTTRMLRVPVIEAGIPAAKPQTMPKPSPYWGDENYWNDPANPNHLAMDSGGRVWISARFRAQEHQPAYCADHPSAKFVKQDHSFRQLQYFDPKTQTFTQVNTCFDTHHVMFAEDADETIYSNGVRNHVIGWVKTKVLRETGDEAKAQGWCKGYFDVNGDGRIDVGTEPPIPMTGVYGVAVNNLDGSVWGAVPGPVPGRIIRLDPKTCIGEAYEPPFLNPAVEKNSYTPRGIDVDRNGLVWTALAGSGDMASFDRRKCKVTTGPDITNGQHCPEGWTVYPVPGPRFKGTDVGVDYHYYNWVDQFNTLGLGNNIPLTDGTGSDSLLALNPATGQFTTLRVPYPMNFYQRGLDGRIDDPNGGWKGRGLYATYGENAVWHIEGGKGSKGALVKFQLRTTPLDR